VTLIPQRKGGIGDGRIKKTNRFSAKKTGEEKKILIASGDFKQGAFYNDPKKPVEGKEKEVNSGRELNQEILG